MPHATHRKRAKQAQGQSSHIERLPQKEKQNYLTLGLKIIPLLETLLLILALHQLGFGGDSWLGWLKLIVFGLAAYAVSYLIYRMAIEKGATLNSVGYKPAGALSGLSVLLVGIGFFIATAAGLTLPHVEELRLASHIQQQSVYVDARSRQAANTAKLAPVINGIANDLEAKAACEIESSCVSARGTGGYGSTSRMLENLAARAKGLVEQINAGLEKREQLQKSISLLLAHMSETLADEAQDIKTRRADLQQHDVQISRLLNRLEEALPATLIVSYLEELRSGVQITGRPQVTETINRFLNGYATSIEVALAGIKTEEIERPSFPEKAGAMDTFDYIAKFTPIFLLALLIDVAFPLALWGYTIMSLDWERFNKSPDPNRGQRSRSDFDDITEIQTIDVKQLKRPNKADDDSSSGSHSA